uniref:Uncharacterized protein n=1 Tax=Podoviridae sp. ctrub15 TaxID=2826581 RepID=A0A8S5LVA0_9CAUD|nr:MAG TPA: hypothetical protein [Podoviridae sp. ctrub15]
MNPGRQTKGRNSIKETTRWWKSTGRYEALWQEWSRARHGYVVNRRPLAGVQPPRQAKLLSQERSHVRPLSLSEIPNS